MSTAESTDDKTVMAANTAALNDYGFQLAAEMSDVVKKRYVDLALYHMLLDAKELADMQKSVEPIRLVNKRLFRQDEETPVVDELVANPTTIIGLLHNKI